MLLEVVLAMRSASPVSVFSPNACCRLGPCVPDAAGKLGGRSGPWLTQQGRSRQGRLAGGKLYRDWRHEGRVNSRAAGVVLLAVNWL